MAPADAIVLRDASPADAAAISALVRALTQRWIAPDCDEDGLASLLALMTPEQVQRRIDEGHRNVVAECDGRIVGVAVLRLPSHLYHLFVADDMQRRGLARALCNAVTAAADPAVPITVNAARHAQETYRRLGFEATGPELHESGLRFVPMQWMRR